VKESENVDVVRQAFQCFGAGDIAGLLNQFASDVSWETPGAPRIPYAGRFKGRDQVATFFEGLGRTAEFTQFEPREFVAQGDQVVALGHYAGKGRTTGRPFDTAWAMVFTVQNGKVVKFQEYFDTANLGAAFT
jgi:ketosteroid isomerase-like protein